MRRAPRIVLAGLVAALAVAGLAGCRTSPNVAAYVGDQTITVDELQSAVDSRLQDDAVAKAAKSDRTAFTRQVLSLLVGQKVYAAAADHWNVTVSDAEVRDRIQTLLAGQNADDVYAQLAAKGISREDVDENIREQLVRQKIARAEGLDDQLSDAALQQQYQQSREQYKQLEFGYIAVPDQATADAVLAQLQADPASYPTVAAQYNNGVTLLQTETRPADQLPQGLSQQLLTTAPGTGFTVPVQGLGVVVAFVTGATYQPFEAVRSDLQSAAESKVDAAALKLVRQFRDSLTITPNPRYGALRPDDATTDSGLLQVVESQCGVVRPAGADPASCTQQPTGS